jgi:hypothetical protein
MTAFADRMAARFAANRRALASTVAAAKRSSPGPNEPVENRIAAPAVNVAPAAQLQSLRVLEILKNVGAVKLSSRDRWDALSPVARRILCAFDAASGRRRYTPRD